MAVNSDLELENLHELELVYPVGNTHLPYYKDVINFFQDEGADPEKLHIMTVGSDLVGWWLKDRFPDSEVTVVEANEDASYLQNFAGYYLSNELEEGSVEELKHYMGINDRSNVTPGFLDQGETPEEIKEVHQDFVSAPETPFQDVPDFSGMSFAYNEFYPEILEEIKSNSKKPNRFLKKDLRQVELEADIVFTNNIIDKIESREFIDEIDRITSEESYVELYASSEKETTRTLLEDYSNSNSFTMDFNPEVDFWWTPLTQEQERDQYTPLLALKYP